MMELIIIAGIPTAITGFFFWMLERKITARDKKDAEARSARQEEMDNRERAQEKLQITMINGINASIALGEATAKAVQRIPDAHCNGDMHAALDYASKVKHEQKEFITEQGIQHII